MGGRSYQMNGHYQSARPEPFVPGPCTCRPWSFGPVLRPYRTKCPRTKGPGQVPKDQGPVEGRSFGGSLVPQHDGYSITREAFWQIANQLEWVQHHLALTPSALWRLTGEGSEWSPGWGGAASSLGTTKPPSPWQEVKSPFCCPYGSGRKRVARIRLCVYNRLCEQSKANNLYCGPDFGPAGGLCISHRGDPFAANLGHSAAYTATLSHSAAHTVDFSHTAAYTASLSHSAAHTADFSHHAAYTADPDRHPRAALGGPGDRAADTFG